MKTDLDIVASHIDCTAPIDFELLKREVEANGPLRISKPNNPYMVYLTPTPCRCANEGCTSELVMVSRKHGMFEMQWVLSKDDFMSFSSIDAFFSHVVSGELQDSRGERMILEEHIERVLRMIGDISHELGCSCPKCLAPHLNEDSRNMFLLSQLSNLLIERRSLLDDAREWDSENSILDIEDMNISETESGRLEDWVDSAFETGYALGRNFSEYSGKATIEPLAMLGVTAKETKAKREAAAGEKSREQRDSRRSELLDKMEALVSRSPDIVRFGPEQLAKVALEDCINDNPSLWRQGKGQVNEYLGEIRRGDEGVSPEMQMRYQAIFGSKPLKRLR